MIISRTAQEAIAKDVAAMDECDRLMTHALQSLEAGNYAAAKASCLQVLEQSDGIEQRLASMQILTLACRCHQDDTDAVLQIVYNTDRSCPLDFANAMRLCASERRCK